jgi:hypothetical protein
MTAHRLAGAALVVLLHVALLALLLQAGFAPRAAQQARETILLLMAPKPVVADKPSAPPPQAPRPLVRVPRIQILPMPRTPGVDPKALEGFGQALLDCRPENLADLPPEQRDRCDALSLKPRDRDAVDFADHTNRRSRDAALWARGRDRKNAPLLLPCMGNQGLGVSLGTPLCLLKGAVKGFKPDEQAQYGDRQDPVHIPNNGDPHPTYVEPDHY